MKTSMIFACAAFFGLAPALPAVEPWSDDGLAVQEGLEIWFDCSRQNAARAQLQLPPVSADSSADYLLDGSGHARHLAQPMPGARPRFRRESKTAFLSFDGNGTALTASLLHGDLTKVTVFIVAAPRSNRGGFRALFALSRAGANDYTTGLNVDLGPAPTTEFSYLNVEGNGTVGAAQMLNRPPLAFGSWHVLSLESQTGTKSVRLFLDGKIQGVRDRGDSTLRLGEFVLGARHFSNTGEPPHTQGFFDGDIAEFLLYGRLLTEPERAAVEQYLSEKYAALLKPALRAAGETQPLEPADIDIPGEPPPRKRGEIEAVLQAARAGNGAAAPAAPFPIVLCAGPKDHGPSEHDYPLWQKRWAKLLALADNVTVSTAWEWPSPEQFRTAKVIVFYSDNPGWNQNRAAELDACLNRGCGLVFIHYAVDGHQDVEALAQRIGLAWRGGFSKFRHGPLDLKLEPGPLTAGLNPIHFVDESYWNLVGDNQGCQLVASAVEDGQRQPLIWTRTQGKGRVFVNILGHYTWTFDDPLFRLLSLRGICWAGGEPPDRLSKLALIGARVADHDTPP